MQVLSKVAIIRLQLVSAAGVAADSQQTIVPLLFCVII
jgi:hypothetical protein